VLIADFIIVFGGAVSGKYQLGKADSRLDQGRCATVSNRN
jgi:hypothetical protein